MRATTWEKRSSNLLPISPVLRPAVRQITVEIWSWSTRKRPAGPPLRPLKPWPPHSPRSAWWPPGEGGTERVNYQGHHSTNHPETDLSPGRTLGLAISYGKKDQFYREQSRSLHWSADQRIIPVLRSVLMKPPQWSLQQPWRFQMRSLQSQMLSTTRPPPPPLVSLCQLWGFQRRREQDCRRASRLRISTLRSQKLLPRPLLKAQKTMSDLDQGSLPANLSERKEERTEEDLIYNFVFPQRRDRPSTTSMC